MKVGPPSTFFGLSRALGADEARSLASFLSQVWLNQRGRLPAGLESDLSDLERFFSPTSTGRRLREAILALPKIESPRPSSLTEEIFLDSPSGRGLVTPEGRITLYLLEEQGSSDPVVFSTDEVAWAYGRIADLYRSWGRDRILEALGIKEGALRLPVIAFNLVLLVNGSIGKDKALPIPSDETDEQELSSVVGPVIDRFVKTLRPDRKKSESFRLRGGWVLTETSRHLFHYVNYRERAVWIRPNATKALVHRLGRELARDKSRVETDVQQAFDNLLTAYTGARPSLASRGLVYERSAHSREILGELLTSFDKARTLRRE